MISAVEHDDQQHRFQMMVPAGLKWFEGHFIDQPVLPGVVQVLWARELISEYIQSGSVNTIKKLKFNQMILPDTQVVLQLKHKPEKRQTAFTYFRGDDVCSTGVFE